MTVATIPQLRSKELAINVQCICILDVKLHQSSSAVKKRSFLKCMIYKWIHSCLYQTLRGWWGEEEKNREAASNLSST